MKLVARMKLTYEEQVSIELLAVRLKNSVTSLQILGWLDNFKSDHRELAHELLLRLEYITEQELQDIADKALQAWFTKVRPQPGDRILFNPVGDIGKSGTLITYYLQKTPTFIDFKKHNDVKFLPSEEALWNIIDTGNFSIRSHIVFYDDFGGSGKSVDKYLRKFIGRLAVGGNIISISTLLLFGLSTARKYLTEKWGSFNHILQEERHKVFVPRHSPFGIRAKEIREIAYLYGSRLYQYPLGYLNSQALLVFPYGCPNNTIPIIWSNKDDWTPLYPRFPERRISDAKRIRRDYASTLSQFREMGGSLFVTGSKKLPWKSIQFITRTDFLTFGLIRCLRQGRDKPAVCQILGITGADFDDLISEAIRRGILDEQRHLTLKGMEEYDQLLYQSRNVRREILKTTLPVSDAEMYIPKAFEGES